MICVTVRYDPKAIDSVFRATLRRELPSIIAHALESSDSQSIEPEGVELEMYEVGPESVNCLSLAIRVFAGITPMREANKTLSLMQIYIETKKLFPKHFSEMSQAYIRLTLEDDSLVFFV